DLREAPQRCGLAPEARKLLRVGGLVGELVPRIPEFPLVPVELVLDRAQAPHPDRRPAERADRGVGVRPEVAQPLAKRLPLDRARLELLLEQLPLPPVL